METEQRVMERTLESLLGDFDCSISCDTNTVTRDASSGKSLYFSGPQFPYLPNEGNRVKSLGSFSSLRFCESVT